MVSTIEHADKPTGFRALANPIKIDGARPPDRCGPRMGEHTDPLLEELGVKPNGG